jgi:hypothetical protein
LEELIDLVQLFWAVVRTATRMMRPSSAFGNGAVRFGMDFLYEFVGLQHAELAADGGGAAAAFDIRFGRGTALALCDTSPAGGCRLSTAA